MAVRETICNILKKTVDEDTGILGQYVDNGQMILHIDSLGVKTECWDVHGTKYQ